MKHEQSDQTPGNWGQRFEDWFDGNPLPMMAFDRESHVILAVNEAAIRQYGYSREEFLAMTIKDLRPPEEASRQLDNLRRVDQGFTGPFIGQHRKKDGAVFDVEIYLQRQTEGGRTFVVTQIRDVTEPKRTQEALQLSEKQCRLVIDGVRDYAIFMLNPEGRVTTWNSGAESVFGYLPEEIIGQPHSRLCAAEDLARAKPEEELRVAASQGRYEEEGWRVRKDGSRFWANVIITALRDETGQVRGFAEITRDFSERKRADEVLLLEITNSLISNLEADKLLAAIATSIKGLKPHFFASIAFYDPGVGKLRMKTLTPIPGKGHPQEFLIPLEHTPAGKAFTAREPVLLNHMETHHFDPHIVQQWIRGGVKSACWLPLLHDDKCLGVLTVASEHEAAFTQQDVSLLGRISGQVAIALDSALAFRQLTQARERLAEEKLYLEEELNAERNFEQIIGKSSGLKRVLKEVETVAPTDATVLILGETGTGKELIARAIHNLSARRGQNFVSLSCAAIPAGLLESELFGHEKGAFTGAIASKLGRLELADLGTLLLDEVGDIPLELQPKLLRALQEREFERLGSNRSIPVDVRLIAATNRDLGKMVEDRQFRSELYYRLKVFPITVPPLRERSEDVPLLVRHFVQKHARKMNRRIETIPDEVMSALLRWRWPGNVRELENFIERAVILSTGSVLRAPLKELEATPAGESSGNATLEAAEREQILRALREAGGVIGGPHGAATRLGIPRTTLNAKMRKLGIFRRDI